MDDYISSILGISDLQVGKVELFAKIFEGNSKQMKSNYA
jgi:hypothetical protein